MATLHKEQPKHHNEIEALHECVFGPGRFARAAFRIRENGGHDLDLSHIIVMDDKIIASVRLTPIIIGQTPALLLGPLAVLPEFARRGFGAMLIKESINVAEQTLILLVGDEAYYGRFGFKPVPVGSIVFPAPVDKKRILVFSVLEGATGMVRHRSIMLPQGGLT
jgi:predicted N-acetyltransferase YhbS